MIAILDSFPEKINYICSNTNSTGDLIAFGEDVYEKYVNSGCQFLKHNESNHGAGFIAYRVLEDKILIDEIFADTPNKVCLYIVVSSMINILSNDARALKKKIVFTSEDDRLFDVFKKINQYKKEQKQEDKYWWKLE